MAERALELMVARVQERKTFGRQLASHGVVLDNIARSRIKLEAARLLVLNAAAKMDQVGPKAAKKEIGIAKVAVPNIALDIVDKAVQMFGAAGVSQDTPLAYFWGALRTLRLADGPDEIHIRQIAKQEIADQNRKAKL
ncbi:hypothetical protein H4219_002302 [Mycoemilia scoparia]|uniref:Acyl-CoA dehydrogenase/oxidase C-terminal domain-containing protein n=1 Tax=Mycoemilia scoparia TaxID=417184 RepID=A0A9W8DPA9_9FUNG|nr:hypothetical protein H4219_002302 [Mycoemilia scoparia]